jgi:catechol 2,3-dioxygenase-like lactoylglutathione lyase family enzyme
MARRIALSTVLVRDYDEALAFFTGVLGFAVREDKPLDGAGRRWVTVAPPGGGAGLLLTRADGPEQAAGVGRQAAGRVAFLLETDDVARDHAAFTAGGVRFTEAPRREDYGTVAVFEDPYGNLWDLIEPST